MSEVSSAPEMTPETPETNLPESPPTPQPTFVKLAMRNMVRKKGQSFQHFALTTVGLLTLLVGLSYLTARH